MQIEVGICYIILKPLVYLFDIMKNLSAFGPDSKIGSLNVEAFPCDQYGNKIDEDDLEDDLCDPLQ